jgi:hypothetical protein
MKPDDPRRKALRVQVVILVLVGVVLAMASVLSRRFFESAQPELPAGLSHLPQAQPQNNPSLFRVAALQGEVEAFQKGQWYLVRVGHLLSPQDVIRCKTGARALLRRGRVEIELRDNMDLRLDDLEKETAKVGLLRGGKVSATVGSADEHVEITARHTKTANVGAARFVVSLSESGKVSVASSEGTARFSGKGKDVLVTGGKVSTALPEQAPGEPESLPQELLLSVVWPEDDRIENQARIKGKAQPSTRISINGVETNVSGDGVFQAAVPLKPGKNHIEVEAEDIVGRKKTIERVLTRGGSAPTLEQTNQELWNP